MFKVKEENLCLEETNSSVTSISTQVHVPQPIKDKAHFVHNRIFVGGFPKSTLNKDLASVFQSYGEVIEANVIISNDGSKVYGFVTFHPQHANVVDIILHQYAHGKVFYLRDKPLLISRAAFKPKKPSSVLIPEPIKKVEQKIIKPPCSFIEPVYVNFPTYYKNLELPQRSNFNGHLLCGRNENANYVITPNKSTNSFITYNDSSAFPCQMPSLVSFPSKSCLVAVRTPYHTFSIPNSKSS